MRYLTIWHDDEGLPRAWGAADDQATAEAQADIEADEYRRRRPDVVLANRTTHEFLADGVAVEIADTQPLS